MPPTPPPYRAEHTKFATGTHAVLAARPRRSSRTHAVPCGATIQLFQPVALKAGMGTAAAVVASVSVSQPNWMTPPALRRPAMIWQAPVPMPPVHERTMPAS